MISTHTSWGRGQRIILQLQLYQGAHVTNLQGQTSDLVVAHIQGYQAQTG